MGGYLSWFSEGIAELVGILIYISIPFLLYIPGGELLRKIGVTPIYSDPVAFLTIWFISLNLYFFSARRLHGRVRREMRLSRLNRTFGAIPGLFRGVVIVTLLVTIFAVLCGSQFSQGLLGHSVFAPRVVNVMTLVTSAVADVFGEAVRNAMGFLTVPPDNDERIALGFRAKNPMLAPESEEQMLRLVNEERAHRGLIDSTGHRVNIS